MIKISHAAEKFLKKIYPNLEHNMKLAQMKPDLGDFFKKVVLLSIIFTVNLEVIFFLMFSKTPQWWILFPLVIVLFLLFFILFLQIPHFNIMKVKREIEESIFVPARMLLTLLESGNSIVSALEKVSYTEAKASKYFGKIASGIYLGKSISKAIEEAIKFTPSDSFRRVLEPIKKSLMTGTNIEKNLRTTLQELSKEKIIEIEAYEKKLGALSLFYMIFGTIIPAVSVVGIVIVMSIIGLEVKFFPILFLILIFILFIQLMFINTFKSVRPLMRI